MYFILATSYSTILRNYSCGSAVLVIEINEKFIVHNRFGLEPTLTFLLLRLNENWLPAMSIAQPHKIIILQKFFKMLFNQFMVERINPGIYLYRLKMNEPQITF